MELKDIYTLAKQFVELYESQQPKPETKTGYLMGYQLEAGKWYYLVDYPNDNFLFRFSGNLGDNSSYGFNRIREWSGHNMLGVHGTDKCRTAPIEEVEQRLIQEAKRQGFKEGVTIKNILSGTNGYLSHDHYVYYETDDDLYLGGWLIYSNGTWATITE